MDFIYDESGKPFALKYTDGTAETKTYYYILNLQGDVVELVEHTQTLLLYRLNTVATYTYNAWGEIVSATGDMAEINPLRYRGYYYDVETGFYYLQSRYYDPTMHRFINADSLASTGQGFVGTNMFAYCNNNPISYCDYNGQYSYLAGQFDTQASQWGAGGSKGLPELEENFLTKLKKLTSTAAEILVEVCKIGWNSLEISAGVGGGFYTSNPVSVYPIDFTGGFRGDFFRVGIKEGKIYWTTEMCAELSVTLLKFVEIGAREQVSIKKNEVVDRDSFMFFNNKKETISIFGGGAYLMYGGSYDISINLMYIWKELGMIQGE